MGGGKGISDSGTVCTKAPRRSMFSGEVCSVNAETSGGFGEEADGLGGSEAEGTESRSPGGCWGSQRGPRMSDIPFL